MPSRVLSIPISLGFVKSLWSLLWSDAYPVCGLKDRHHRERVSSFTLARLGSMV